MIGEVTAIKLNLGSRDRRIPGYFNVDLADRTDSFMQDKNVDYWCDVGELSKIFAANSISEIYASHILEHFPHTKTLDVLKEWNKILVQNGILRVAVPDFKRAIELYHSLGLQTWIINFLYGDQVYDKAFHYTAFDEMRLTAYLEKAGFKDITRVEGFGLHKTDCSNNRSDHDGKLVSLNMVAIKK